MSCWRSCYSGKENLPEHRDSHWPQSEVNRTLSGRLESRPEFAKGLPQKLSVQRVVGRALGRSWRLFFGNPPKWPTLRGCRVHWQADGDVLFLTGTIIRRAKPRSRLSLKLDSGPRRFSSDAFPLCRHL